MSRLDKALDAIRESEAYQQLKQKYDELDSQTKLYVNLGVLGGGLFLVLFTVFFGIAKVNSIKSEINEREELIGYLNSASDNIKQLRAQQAAKGAENASNLPAFAEMLLGASAIAPAKAEVGSERPGQETKEASEALLDVKLNQINLRQLTQFLFNATVRGTGKGLNIKDLAVDTKGDPTGYIDATVTFSIFRAKQ
ncbi:MAG: hypothetical protein AB1540_09055 [Bdellovibrionota bacterium]